jgi:hypothetical protein
VTPYLALGAPDRLAFADTLLEERVALEDTALDPALPLIAGEATDPRLLAKLGAILRARLVAGAEAEGTIAPILGRAIEGLEARVDLLEGRTAEGLARFERLASDTYEVVSEGTLFERTRWVATLALQYAQLGMVDRAHDTWQRLLAMSYPRVLTMEATLLARAHLRAL